MTTISKSSEDSTVQSPVKPNIFFVRKATDKRLPKPSPVVYDIYHCVRCVEKTKADTKDRGTWAALIIRHPQEADQIRKRMGTYMLSSTEEEDHHIKIRLNSVLQTLNWIVSDVSPELYQYIEVTITTSDIFIVNLLREWLPRWERKAWKVRGTEIRPNIDLLKQIANIALKIKLNVGWQADQSNELVSVSEKVDDMLSRISLNADSKV